MPCRRSWVRAPSSALSKAPETGLFCCHLQLDWTARDAASQVLVRNGHVRGLVAIPLAGALPLAHLTGIGLAESAEIVNNDREKASNSIAKFTKQPIELVKATPPNRSEPTLKPEQLAWWIEVMSSQKMLQSRLDTSKLVLK